MPNYQNCNKVTYKPVGASTETVLIDLTSDTVEANKMLLGTTAHDKSGGIVTGSISSKSAATYNVSSSNQTISASQYLSGAQTIRAVTTSGISAANIAYGVTVKVGDAGDDDRIIGVTGTYTTIASGGATAAKILSGYSAYVNGQLIQGSITTYDGTVVTT